MNWKRMLAYVTGSVDQQLLLRNEYLATENQILRNQIKGRLRLSNSECISLAEIGKRLGRKALEDVAQIVRPETILTWHRKLVAKKFDGSKNRSSCGRPPTPKSLEDLVLEMARDNRSWGYKRLVGALENLGHKISRQTIANILQQEPSPPPTAYGPTSLGDLVVIHALGLIGKIVLLFPNSFGVRKIERGSTTRDTGPCVPTRKRRWVTKCWSPWSADGIVVA